MGRLGRVVLCRLPPEAYARLLGDGREPPRWALEWERRAIGSDTIGLVHAPGRPRPLAALLEAVREEVAAGPLSPPASPDGNAGASAPSP